MEGNITLKIDVKGTIWNRTTFTGLTQEQVDEFIGKLKSGEIKRYCDFEIEGVYSEYETMYETFEELTEEKNNNEPVLWAETIPEEDSFYISKDKKKGE